jgi:hypothetical protein
LSQQVETKSPARKKLCVPRSSDLPKDLGEYITRDANLVRKLGWSQFVKQRRNRSDFSSLNIKHPAKRLLLHYKNHGAPVKFSTPPWDKQQLHQAITRGPHRSSNEHIDYLEEEFIDMINKGQWTVIPYTLAKTLPGLRLSPPGVIPQRGRRPRWICDYTWYGVNQDTLPLAPTEAMQFGHALDRYLRELILADPSLGPLYMLKLDISDGFYRIAVAPNDIPKLGVVFPNRPHQEKLVALPLVLPMGWKNSPPVFSAATETAADIANTNLQNNISTTFHPLESHAAALDQDPASISKELPASTSYLPAPTLRDPSLPSSSTPISYVDVFVDDFIAICQGENNKSHVRQTLLHAVDSIFRPTDFKDSTFRREPVSIKKLRQGDVSWNTIKLVLGWIINTSTMTIQLPPHRQERLGEILASIPSHQKRLSCKKWHKILGELRSMSLALPGARNMFSVLQLALSNSQGSSRIALKKGVHNTLNDFRWMYSDICKRPTRIAEIVPLAPSALGYHDAAGSGAGGVWYPAPELSPRQGVSQGQPLLWRLQWPKDIIQSLVTESNPHGSITNSDLELAGGLLHLDIIAQHYDVRERTIVSKTDNLATMFWQRKGSTTTDQAPAHLLRLFGIHQRYHRYVPRHDYIPGPSNPMADDASRLFHLSNTNFLSYFNSSYQQSLPYLLVHPTSRMSSSVISALRKKTCSVESLLVAPTPPTHIGQSGASSQLSWASTPYSKPSKVKYPSFKSSSIALEEENWQPEEIKSSLDRLRSTYGQLHRRTSPWGPQTPA